MGAPLENKELFAVFTKVYKDAGYDLKIEVLPPARSYAEVDLGKMVGFVSAEESINTAYTTAVIKIGFGKEPLMKKKIIAWVRTQDIDKYQSKETWSKLRVGYVFGIPVSKEFADKTGAENLIKASSFENAVKMLSGDRFDIFFVAEGSIDSFMKGIAITPIPQSVSLVNYWHIIPANMLGTPAEKKIRDSFLANRAALENVLIPKK